MSSRSALLQPIHDRALDVMALIDEFLEGRWGTTPYPLAFAQASLEQILILSRPDESATRQKVRQAAAAPGMTGLEQELTFDA